MQMKLLAAMPVNAVETLAVKKSYSQTYRKYRHVFPCVELVRLTKRTLLTPGSCCAVWVRRLKHSTVAAPGCSHAISIF